MKPIRIKNDYGETIEIKYDAEGGIKIRHSDIDPKRWGELHEYEKRLRQPEIHDALAVKGIDLSKPETREALDAISAMGGYTLLRGKSYIISAKEVAMIHEAIKQAGGIIPNWSNRP
jgi:hypothetical protein